jgi:hypothetical protein
MIGLTRIFDTASPTRSSTQSTIFFILYIVTWHTRLIICNRSNTAQGVKLSTGISNSPVSFCDRLRIPNHHHKAKLESFCHHREWIQDGSPEDAAPYLFDFEPGQYALSRFIDRLASFPSRQTSDRLLSNFTLKYSTSSPDWKVVATINRAEKDEQGVPFASTLTSWARTARAWLKEDFSHASPLNYRHVTPAMRKHVCPCALYDINSLSPFCITLCIAGIVPMLSLLNQHICQLFGWIQVKTQNF